MNVNVRIEACCALTLTLGLQQAQGGLVKPYGMRGVPDTDI